MKLAFLENFEEKFYFKTSHYFWHVLTGIGGLALVVGALILLWGLTPSFKPGVKKPKYPKPVKVSIEEVQKRIQPPETKKITQESKTTDRVKTATSKTEKTDETLLDKDEASYLVSLDSLKSLLPLEKFPWKSKGHWDRSYYRKKWVVDVWGRKDRLKSIYKKVNANEYKSKQQLLDSYISIVVLFPESERYTALKSVIDFSKSDVFTSVQNVELLKQAVPLFPTEKADFLKSLTTFGKKNPRDGKQFIEYVIKIAPKFDLSFREEILSTVIKSYYNYFNLIGKQEEATNLYLEIYDKFETENQANALVAYYKIFINKNKSRDQQVEMLEREYRSGQSHAESVLHRKQSKKSGYRLLGLEVVGGSIVFIAFVALFLVLLSIQRNVRELRMETLKRD